MTLTTPQLADILSHVTYKDGWTFTVYDGRWEGQHLVIRTEVPDAANPGQTTTLDVHSMLPPQRDEEQFLGWLMWRLARIETHEMREFFRFRGELVDDPHADGADRDEPRSAETVCEFNVPRLRNQPLGGPRLQAGAQW